jgi:hypothetical protein
MPGSLICHVMSVTTAFTAARAVAAVDESDAVSAAVATANHQREREPAPRVAASIYIPLR